jgi:hypothetical protein
MKKAGGLIRPFFEEFNSPVSPSSAGQREQEVDLLIYASLAFSAVNSSP